MKVPSERIRNVALVGHAGTGKTTLAEALLAAAGAIPQAGTVEEGSTTSDWQPEERRRGASLALASLPFLWGDHKINLIDTPGDPDFEGEALAALRVADLALFVVSAVEGVEVQHERLWRASLELDLPRMVFINKLDRERSSFERTLEQLRESFGAGVAPLELPVGIESSFRGVVDLLTDEAHVMDGGEMVVTGVPDDLAATEHQVHDNLVEGIVVADDEMLERYLGGDVPSVAELEKTLAEGIDDATVFPVVCGSALTGIGVARLADLVCEVGPSPLDRPPTEVTAGDAVVQVAPDPGAQPLAFVFKTVVDPYMGHVSLFKVLSGTIRHDAHLFNRRTSTDERIHNLFALRGKEHLEIEEAPAGDIAAVAKLASTRTGDTLAPKHMPVTVEGLTWPEPGVATAVRVRVQSDEDKLANALRRLADEDPALVLDRDEHHQTVLRCTGETHLQVTLERLAERYGVEVDLDEVRIPYRETVTTTAEAEGRYKKQSGGHGQFGVVRIRIEPLERGAGFEFVDAVVGGAIPRQYIPAVEKGVVEAMAEGGEHGFPVVDVRVICHDGKHHPVDSSEMSFKMAGRLALREAVAAAGPIVLEPVSSVEVTVPTDLQGEVLGDLSSRRARVQGSELTSAGDTVIKALVPTVELQGYGLSLKSRTSGRGRFRARHDHHEPMPGHMAATVG